jgi:CRP-like cAMP-binding protein
MRPVKPDFTPDIRLLRGLAAQERQAWLARLEYFACAKNEIITERGAKPSHCYFVIEGLVRVVDIAPNGREVTLSDVQPGGFFGELAALDGLPRPTSCVAVVPSVVARMPAAALRDLLRSRVEAAFAFIEDMAAELRVVAERLVETGAMETRYRIYAELLRRARGGGADAPLAITPSPKHQDIAARINASRETVSRELARLTRMGLAEKRGNSLILKDPAALVALIERHRQGGL